MKMAVPDGTTVNTPLAPSVEKAYYRKCIELKRRLNEVEAANDDAKTRRIRLDRAIMKMRLERAFLLDQLSKKMDVDIDGSEGSGDEQVNTPPPDRPHRDKKRKLPGEAGSATRPSDVGARDSPPISPVNTTRGHEHGRSDAQRMDIDRNAIVVGEPVGSGPAVSQDANGERRMEPERQLGA